jgi:DNA-binding NtrC family response regulator
MTARVLIVDDEPTQRRLLDAALGRQGFEVEMAEDGASALARLTQADAAEIDVVLLDLVMPEMDGLAVLERLRPEHPDLPVIVLTAKSGIEVIVGVMRAGAADFVPKPVSPERLRVSVENAIKMRALTGEVTRLSRRVEGALTFDDLVGSSSAMTEAVELAKRAADSSISVLLDGESGVGKEMFARAIQGSGERAGKPFVAVNCGAIPENLIESILFGHEKGAFTGASERHIGKFREADGGTLFLDEIGELRLDMQVKLLRALQEKEIDPIGGKQAVSVDVRVMSATNRELQRLIAEGTFREDLYYRLNVFPIRIPPLRERREDILPLAEYFLRTVAMSEQRPARRISVQAAQLLIGASWPGNVRQLENVMFRAVVLCQGKELAARDFPQIGDEPPPANVVAGEAAPTNFERRNTPGLMELKGEIRPLAEVEADLIRLALERYDGRMSEVARRLGIGRSTLYRKVKELGLEAAQ